MNRGRDLLLRAARADADQQRWTSTTVLSASISTYNERLETRCETTIRAHQLRSPVWTIARGLAPNAVATGSLDASNPDMTMSLGSISAVVVLARIRETSSATRRLPMTPIASETNSAANPTPTGFRNRLDLPAASSSS